MSGLVFFHPVLQQLRAEYGRSQREEVAARLRLDTAVAEARQAGASWSEIGATLGMSAQGAWKRWKRYAAVPVGVDQAKDVG